MKQFLINESDLKPFQKPNPGSSLARPRAAGINVGYWEDWERDIPFANRVTVATPADDAGRIYLSTHKTGNSRVLYRLHATAGVVPFGGTLALEMGGLFAPDFAKNVGVKLPPKGGEVYSFAPAYSDNPTGLDQNWVIDAAPFEWLRFLLPLRTNEDRIEGASATEIRTLRRIANLCRTLGKRPWITGHHTWSKEFRGEVAAIFAGLRLIYEHCNEPWHPQWSAGRHFKTVGMDRFNESDPKRALGPQLWAYAQDAQQAFDDMRAALGSEVTCVAGAQWANPWTTKQILEHCQPDFIGVAPYFGGKVGRFDYHDPSLENMRMECAAEAHEVHVKTLAEQHGSHGTELKVYECGPHVFPVGKVTDEHRDRMIEFNRSEAMADLMRQHLASLEAANLEPTFYCLHKSQLRTGDAAFAGNPHKMNPVLEWLKG